MGLASGSGFGVAGRPGLDLILGCALGLLERILLDVLNFGLDGGGDKCIDVDFESPGRLISGLSTPSLAVFVELCDRRTCSTLSRKFESCPVSFDDEAFELPENRSCWSSSR